MTERTGTVEALQRVISLAGAVQQGRGEWRAKCPVHGGNRKDTFVVREEGDKLLFYCHAGCTQDEIISWAIENNCWPNSGPQSRLLSVSEQEWKKWNGASLVATYTYPEGVVRRYEKRGSSGEVSKDIIPFFRDGGSTPGFPTADDWTRPIYDPNHSLEKSEKIYVVEGEKCVDFLAEKGINAISWLGGSCAVDKVDWSPLSGKTVFFWPDKDAPGKKAAGGFLRAVQTFANVKIVEPPEQLGDGEDCADLPDWTREQLLAVFEKKRAPLVTFSALEFINLNIPPPVCHSGFVFSQSLGMIHAWRGVGKSWFALSSAFAIATAQPFMKYPAPEQATRVLYLDGEMGPYTLQKRLALLLEMNDGVSPELLTLVNPQYNEGTLPRLSTPEGREAYGELISKHDHKVIFVDNISRFVGGDDSEVELWEPVEDWALTLRKEGRTVFFIHHSGKSGAQRGTSRREDTLEYVVGLRAAQRSEQEGPSASACFEVHFEKTRDEFDNESFVALLATAPDPDKGNLAVRQFWRTMSRREYQVHRALNLMAQNYPLRQIAKILGEDKESLEDWIAQESTPEEVS